MSRTDLFTLTLTSLLLSGLATIILSGWFGILDVILFAALVYLLMIETFRSPIEEYYTNNSGDIALIWEVEDAIYVSATKVFRFSLARYRGDRNAALEAARYHLYRAGWWPADYGYVSASQFEEA